MKAREKGPSEPRQRDKEEQKRLGMHDEKLERKMMMKCVDLHCEFLYE